MEVLDPTLPVPLDYINTLGSMDLLDLDLDLGTLFPETANEDAVKIDEVPPMDNISQALRYLNLCQHSSADISIHHASQLKIQSPQVLA